MTFYFQFILDSMAYILLFTFLAICILFILNRKNLHIPFVKIKKTTWILLISILILGSFFRIIYPTCSADGGTAWNYILEGEDMLKGQKLYYLEYPSGYSFITALSFLLFGVRYEAVFFLNMFLSCATILLVFLITYMLFKRDDVSLFSAMVYSFLPISLQYAKLNLSEITGTFFAALTVLIFLMSLEINKKWLYALAGALLAFAIHVRLDNTIFIAFFLIGILWKRKSVSFSRLKIPIILFLILMVPVSYYYTNVEKFHSDEVYPHAFSFSYLPGTIPIHISSLANLKNASLPYPLAFYVFLLISPFFIRRGRNLIFPMLWIGLFLLFYGSYRASFEVNLHVWHLLIEPPMAIMAGYGIFSIKDGIETMVKKKLQLKFSYEMKTFALVITLILVFLLFSQPMKPFGEVCGVEDTFYMSKYIGDEDCLLVEDVGADDMHYKPIRIINVLLPGRKIHTNSSECRNRQTFYLYANDIECGKIGFFGYGKPLMNTLKNETVLTEVDRKGCVILYRVDAK